MPLLYAHRGASAELPENTIPAFLRALEVGATAIETDVHRTRDGHVVISHDPTGERAARRPCLIRAATLAEVKEWDVGSGPHVRRGRAAPGERFTMPTLEEALEAVPGVPFNVDIKQHDDAAAAAVVEAVRRAGAEARVLLTSFDARTVQRVRRLGYRGPTGLGQAEVLRLITLPVPVHRRFPLVGRAAQIPVRAGPIRLDSPALITRAHRLGIEVHYWTINEPAEAERLLSLGADAIMTDDPAAIAPVFGRLQKPVQSGPGGAR
jgi:glycerophosphoryl diester phosphodiesterase